MYEPNVMFDRGRSREIPATVPGIVITRFDTPSPNEGMLL